MIQLERGWTEVISGTVAISSGVITFALGVVVVRLQALRYALVYTEPRDIVAPAEMDEPAYEPPPGEFRLTLHPPQSADEPVPQPPVDVPEPPPETRHGLWKRVRRPVANPQASDEGHLHPGATNELELQGTLPALVREPGANDADEHTSVEPPAPEDDPRQRRGPASQFRPLVEERPDFEADNEEVAMPLRGAALTATWLSQPILKLRPQPPLVLDPMPSAETESDRDVTESSSDPSDGGPAVAAIEDDVEPAEPEVPEPTVVGRYQAGVASYVMYSDGTINVETDGGEVHRFESMDELKTFIARQDASVT